MKQKTTNRTYVCMYESFSLCVQVFNYIICEVEPHTLRDTLYMQISFDRGEKRESSFFDVPLSISFLFSFIQTDDSDWRDFALWRRCHFEQCSKGMASRTAMFVELHSDYGLSVACRPLEWKPSSKLTFAVPLGLLHDAFVFALP